MSDEDLSRFLSGRNPIFSDEADWSKGQIQLEINYYLSDVIPPLELISSVRAIVFKREEVLTVEEAENEFHILPGGRREENERLEETAQREVAEETGWTLYKLKPFSVAHFKHTTPKPEDYPYPYPNFLWLIYTAEAVDFDRERMFSAERLAEEYVISSLFRPISQTYDKLTKRDQALLKVLMNSK